MKISELWIRKWVNPKVNTKKLIEKLTISGLETEKIESIPSNIKNVLVGEIIECINHPKNKNLFLTKINLGFKNSIQIISNAKNCRTGLKVAVAKIGSLIKNNHIVKEQIIHNYISEGILCSYNDLSISQEKLKIIELPLKAIIGKNVQEYLNLVEDNILKINFAINRPDCSYVLGIAREISAIFNSKIKKKIKTKPTKNLINKKNIKVNIEKKSFCPNFLYRTINNINNKKQEISNKIKERLIKSNINITNTIKDIINYILIEIGQPIQIYDLDKIKGDLLIRKAKKNEKITINDNKKLELNEKYLVISDQEKLISVAGGLIEKEVSINRDTKNILLESSFFYSSDIINQKIKEKELKNESYIRYEKGIDYKLQNLALEKITQLIIKFFGGKAGKITHINNTKNFQKKKIILTKRNLSSSIGIKISKVRIFNILKSLGFNISQKNEKNKWKIIVPSWRSDINIEEDLIEEILRIYGYDKIYKLKNFPSKKKFIEKNFHRHSKLSLNKIKNLLVNREYNEIVTYSFVDPKVQSLFHNNLKSLNLINPISNEMSSMRLSLITGLIKTAIFNQNRQQNKIRIFEAGFKFSKDLRYKNGVNQALSLGGLISGLRYENNWLKKKREVDFFDIKGDIESILEISGRLNKTSFHQAFIKGFYPEKTAKIYIEKKIIGFLGMIDPKINKKLDLKYKTFIFELELNQILLIKEKKIHKISKFPINKRDITLTFPKYVKIKDIYKIFYLNRIDYIKKIDLIDIYSGKNVQKGFRNYTFRLNIQGINRNLTEPEISTLTKKYIKILEKNFKGFHKKP